MEKEGQHIEYLCLFSLWRCVTSSWLSIAPANCVNRPADRYSSSRWCSFSRQVISVPPMQFQQSTGTFCPFDAAHVIVVIKRNFGTTKARNHVSVYVSSAFAVLFLWQSDKRWRNKNSVEGLMTLDTVFVFGCYDVASLFCPLWTSGATFYKFSASAMYFSTSRNSVLSG